MVDVSPTLEFEKSDHVYLCVTYTKEVVLLLFILVYQQRIQDSR
jgi:hypothetical protein